MAIRIKGASVRLFGLSPRVVLGLVIVEPVLAEYGADVILTSGADGRHRRHSEHKQGNAVDCRSWHLKLDGVELTDEEKHALAAEAQKRLGPDFLFQFEPTIPNKRVEHFHLEWRPL